MPSLLDFHLRVHFARREFTAPRHLAASDEYSGVVVLRGSICSSARRAAHAGRSRIGCGCSGLAEAPETFDAQLRARAS